ncbi:MAG: hypothetical protein O7D91_11445 [Planctomycetota bacterium]|nr:hypothetical protein [Planctomycetota bacterium]
MAVLCGVSIQSRSVAQEAAAQPQLEIAPDTKPVLLTLTLRQQAVVRSARALVGRALAEHNEERRLTAAEIASDTMARLLSTNKGQPAIELELLSCNARLVARTKNATAAAPIVHRQHAILAEVFETDQCERWVTAEVDRLRNSRYYDLAIQHLSEIIEKSPDSQMAARFSLLIGDILVQEAYPHGPYEAAVRQYSAVDDRYRKVFPELADAARLRQAKTLWRAGRTSEARELFMVLAEGTDYVIAEEARHYPELMSANK